MNKWTSEHWTNELLPLFGGWALRGWRLIFVTRVNTMQSEQGLGFCLLLYWHTAWWQGLGHGGLEHWTQYIYFTAPNENCPPALGLVKCSRCLVFQGSRMIPETRARGAVPFWGAAGLFSQVCTVGTAPHLADEPCGTLTSCSLLYQVFLSPGSTKVLTSPTESQLTCLLCSPPLFIFSLQCASPLLCFQENSSACTWTASLGPEAFLCCSCARRYRLQNPYAVSQGPMY